MPVSRRWHRLIQLVGKMQGRLLLFHRFFQSACHRLGSFPEAGRIGGHEPVFNLTAAILAMPTQSPDTPASLDDSSSFFAF